MFNPVEEALKKLPEWPRYERQLKAICKMLGEKSYKQMVLETMFDGAPPLVRHLIHAFDGQRVDWRWEHLEHAVILELEIYDEFQFRCVVDVFATDTAINEQVAEALSDDFHAPFGKFLVMFTGVVGKEASWLEGCFCHGDVLVAAESDFKRRRKMIYKTGSALCPWKGKRLVAFALGEGDRMRERVANASTPRFESQLKAPRAIAARISVIETQV